MWKTLARGRTASQGAFCEAASTGGSDCVEFNQGGTMITSSRKLETLYSLLLLCFLGIHLLLPDPLDS
jgi:hypothetical protein